jgi:hypothetical protein
MYLRSRVSETNNLDCPKSIFETTDEVEYLLVSHAENETRKAFLQYPNVYILHDSAKNKYVNIILKQFLVFCKLHSHQKE